jgi:hypothetical protein
MKRTIVQLTLRVLFVGMAFFAFAPLASAHTFTPQAQSQAKVPMQSCGGAVGKDCDHLPPPPLSNCTNNLALDTKTIYDHNKVAIGQLNLFADVLDCQAVWIGLKDINSPHNTCFTITSLAVYETNHDQSAQGALDSIPHLMCSTGQWESTKMNGWTSDGTAYYNYGHSVVTDELGYANDTTNTATVGLQQG